jgi:hypothetical protein
MERFNPGKMNRETKRFVVLFREEEIKKLVKKPLGMRCTKSYMR